MLSFSIDELSKLEQMLHVLHLPADDATELQAGVINRLMDVYYKLNLQATHPEVGGGGCWLFCVVVMRGREVIRLLST